MRCLGVNFHYSNYSARGPFFFVVIHEVVINLVAEFELNCS